MIKLNKRYEILIVLVFCLLVSTPLFAGDPARIGTAAGAQLEQPVGARDLAMGGANIVYTKGVDALYWNPAGLSNMETTFGGMFTRNTVFNSININYVGLGLNIGSLGAVGVDIKSFDFGDIPLTTVQDMDGSSGATFSPTWSTLGITYANKLTNAIQVGIKAKVIYESLPRVSGTAVAFDMGIQYKNLAGIEGVSFGVVMKNIGTSMKYSGSALTKKVTESDGSQNFYSIDASSDQLPAFLEIGAAYDLAINEQNGVLVAASFQNNNVENDAIKFGLEYNFNNMVALRGGYVYTNKAESENVMYTFTLGAGFQYDLGGTIVGIDYAFRDAQYFDSENMFTLRLGF
jgi:hypothetical protein